MVIDQVQRGSLGGIDPTLDAINPFHFITLSYVRRVGWVRRVVSIVMHCLSDPVYM